MRLPVSKHGGLPAFQAYPACSARCRTPSSRLVTSSWMLKKCGETRTQEGKLIKIETRLVYRARRLVFQLAEVAVPRALF